MASPTKVIPDDVVLTILSKLPLNSLNRFTCVHKSWAHLLENSYFMTMFGTNFLSKHHSYYDDTSLLLVQKSEYLMDRHRPPYLLSGDEFENSIKLDWSPFSDDDDELQEGNKFMTIFGSGIHGTLFLHNHESIFRLWNPATQEFRDLPFSPLQYKLGLNVEITPLGFGYDSVRDDFKVIWELIGFSDDDDYHLQGPFWEIYSLRRNAWKELRKLNDHMPSDAEIPSNIGHDLYLNGVCHWFIIVYYYGGQKTHLASFNLSNEEYIKTPLPLDREDRWVHKYLVALNGSIALISKYVQTKAFHIWVLGELNVKKSWTKLFIVGPWPRVEFPIGVGKKGDIFFRKTNGSLVMFDLHTQTFKEIVANERLDCDRIIIYKESILPIGRIDN